MVMMVMPFNGFAVMEKAIYVKRYVSRIAKMNQFELPISSHAIRESNVCWRGYSIPVIWLMMKYIKTARSK